MKNKEQIFLIILIVSIAVLALRALHERNNPIEITGKKVRYIAIPSTGRDVNSPSSYLFGRSQYFIVFDKNKKSFRTVRNKFVDSQHSAGLKASRMLLEMGINVICADNIGFESTRVFHDAKVDIYTNVKATPWATLKAYPKNLTKITEQNVPSHFGITGDKKNSAKNQLNNGISASDFVQGKVFVCFNCGYHLKSAELMAANNSKKVCPRCGGTFKEVIAVSTPKSQGLNPKIKVF